MDGPISCKLILDCNSNLLSVSIINESTGFYFTDYNGLEIYKMNSEGEYDDWGDSYYENLTAHILSNTLTSETVIRDRRGISTIEMYKLEKKFLDKLKPKDSIEFLTIQDDIAIKLSGIKILDKKEEYRNVYDLYPLKSKKGCYKLVFNYSPKNYIILYGKNFNLPKKIDGNERLKFSFKSNEVYLCY
jgi:hypothetical protein